MITTKTENGRSGKKFWMVIRKYTLPTVRSIIISIFSAPFNHKVKNNKNRTAMSNGTVYRNNFSERAVNSVSFSPHSYINNSLKSTVKLLSSYSDNEEKLHIPALNSNKSKLWRRFDVGNKEMFHFWNRPNEDEKVKQKKTENSRKNWISHAKMNRGGQNKKKRGMNNHKTKTFSSFLPLLLLLFP